MIQFPEMQYQRNHLLTKSKVLDQLKIMIAIKIDVDVFKVVVFMIIFSQYTCLTLKDHGQTVVLPMYQHQKLLDTVLKK